MLEVQAGLDGQDLTGRERATQVASFAGTGAVVDVETHHVPRRAQRPAPVQAAVRLQRLLRGDRKNAEVLKSRGENLGARTMVGAEAGARPQLRESCLLRRQHVRIHLALQRAEPSADREGPGHVRGVEGARFHTGVQQQQLAWPQLAVVAIPVQDRGVRASGGDRVVAVAVALGPGPGREGGLHVPLRRAPTAADEPGHVAEPADGGADRGT